MASLERLLTKRLRLKINREKSGCVAVESRAPIVLLQIAVTRGVFKAHRVPRTPTNASSALAKAAVVASGLSAMRFYLDVNVPAHEQNDENDEQQPAPSVTVIAIGTLVIDAAADAEHQDEHD
jgi:hypothetical protein